MQDILNTMIVANNKQKKLKHPINDFLNTFLQITDKKDISNTLFVL